MSVLMYWCMCAAIVFFLHMDHQFNSLNGQIRCPVYLRHIKYSGRMVLTYIESSKRHELHWVLEPPFWFIPFCWNKSLIRICNSCTYQQGKVKPPTDNLLESSSSTNHLTQNWTELKKWCSFITLYKSLCSVWSSRHIQGSSVSWWTLTRTCPSTQSPSWRCTGARNATRCPLTFTPYQRPPIAACYKVLSTICDPLTPD